MAELIAADGCRLHLVAAPAPAQPPRGDVLIVHGLGEHGGRHEALARWLQAGGFAVTRYDQRGHGHSGGRRGGMPAADSLLDDLGRVIAQLRADQPRRGGPAPLVLLGHSLGGLLAARHVAEGLAPRPAAWWQPVDALVLSSPAFDPGMNLPQKALLALLGPLAPGLAIGNGLSPDWICRDPAVVRAYVDDPLVHDRITPRLVRFIVDAGGFVLQAAPRWTVPTLLLYAGADRCVAPRGSERFAASAPTAQLRSRRFDGLFHEIFNEPERAQVFAELARWLDEQMPGDATPTIPQPRKATAP